MLMLAREGVEIKAGIPISDRTQPAIAENKPEQGNITGDGSGGYIGNWDNRSRIGKDWLIGWNENLGLQRPKEPARLCDFETLVEILSLMFSMGFLDFRVELYFCTEGLGWEGCG